MQSSRQAIYVTVCACATHQTVCASGYMVARPTVCTRARCVRRPACCPVVLPLVGPQDAVAEERLLMKTGFTQRRFLLLNADFVVRARVCIIRSHRLPRRRRANTRFARPVVAGVACI